jgi:hypothetical protein
MGLFCIFVLLNVEKNLLMKEEKVRWISKVDKKLSLKLKNNNIFIISFVYMS